MKWAIKSALPVWVFAKICEVSLLVVWVEIPGWLPVCGSSLAVCVGVQSGWLSVCSSSLADTLSARESDSLQLGWMSVCSSSLHSEHTHEPHSRKLQTFADKNSRLCRNPQFWPLGGLPSSLEQTKLLGPKSLKSCWRDLWMVPNWIQRTSSSMNEENKRI